ncbi:recombinase family protein [Jeotgalibacillus campisalis]|uniref:Recombinase n=1 Tax=Jeotgalibacillus campisalis TaxID=220754 RepID=A0A0C2R7G4_9BACL|nr:recombinase family protein [Jeotgalibacillus campisalis]KIL46200.1 recombinase [Jeotgalibacillus campisalis]
MTVGIYIRVSTEEQAKEGYSISAQREKLKAFCLSQDWTDFRFYPDEGVSAKDLKRSEMQLMMKHIQEKKIDTVLVYRLDRLTRSVRDLHVLLDFFEQHGCTFKSATEVFDTTTAMGRLFVTIVGALSSWERENLGERVQFGQIEKARQGEFAAPAPLGYDKINSKLHINEKEAEIVRDMVQRAIDGQSARQISNNFNERGVPTIRGYRWHIATILSILRNPALYGATRWKDEVIENTHEGIISKEEFLKLRKIIQSRQNFKVRDVKSIFIFQMKIECPTCKAKLTCERSKYERKKDKVLVETNGYRCQNCTLNQRPAIRASELKLLKALDTYMANLEIAPSPKKAKSPADAAEKIRAEIVAIDRQRTKYQKAWSMDLMTDDEFSARIRETKNERDALEKKLKKTEGKEPEVDYAKMHRVLNNFNKNWSLMKPDTRRKFMQRFIEKIEIKKEDGRVEITRVHFY